ncbi:MAG: hypothetical protein O3B70_03145 [Bacteroidetes bacterium]|nr:hypothetical protein [Bacteroidota bacterium]MDA1242272.1 hypothetical protein [Bacteroidota bacterium]
MDFREMGRLILPHLGAVVLMWFVAALVFWPSMSDNRALNQGDTTQNIGMAKETRDYQRLEGEIPHWTNSMFGGMPTVQIAGNDVSTAPKMIWKAFRKSMPMEIATVWVAMISAYVLGLCLGWGPWLSLMLAMGFGLASVNVLYLAAGHATKVRTIATIPGVLGGMLMAYRGRVWKGVGVTALFTALHLEASHVQITYYLLFLLAAVALAAGIREWRVGRITKYAQTTALLLLGGVVGALPQAGHLGMTQEYSTYTTRGEAVLSMGDGQGDGPKKIQSSEGLSRGYILEYSMARGEFWSMAIPNVKGGNDRLYWGEQRFSGGAFYFGALAFALCLAWLVAGSHWLRWPLLAVSMLAIVLSWRDTTWVSDFFLDHVPMFNKFRDTKMMLVLLQLAIPLGAAMAIHELSGKDPSRSQRRWFVGAALPVILFATFYAVPEFWFDFTSSIRADQAAEQLGKRRVVGMRIDLFREDVLRSMGWALLAGAALVALLRSWIAPRWVVMGLVVFVALDLASVDGRYLSDKNFVSRMDKRFPFEATQADKLILAAESTSIEGFDNQVASARERMEESLGHPLTRRHQRALDGLDFEVLNANSHFRVLELANPFNDARTSYFFKSVGGYHGAKLRRYQDFIEHVLSGEREAMIRQLQAGDFNLDPRNYPGLRLLNTKYILLPGGDQPLPFPGGLGAAWMVDSLNWVTSDREEVESLAGLDVQRTAVVHEEFRSLLGSVGDPGQNTVGLSAYHPEGSTYEVTSERGGLLVLSEIYYPEGWSATLDGEPIDLVRANYVLRAVAIPEGSHVLELHFEPGRWSAAKAASYAGSFLWLLLLGWSFVRREQP